MKRWEEIYGQRWFSSGGFRLRAMVSALVVALALAFGGSAAAQDWSEFEYEADEGLHEEEWYDPSDWFDTDAGVSFESDDWWDYGYGYGYGYGDYDYDGYNEYYGLSPYYTEDPYVGDYLGADGYTEEWYQDDGVFEGWYD